MNGLTRNLERVGERLGWYPTVTVRSGPAAGIRIGLRNASSPDYRRGTNERPVQEAIAGTLRRGDVFYDVGANVGFFALLSGRLVGDHGHVYAFEPVPGNAGCIATNARRNGLGNVTVVEAAVGNEDGTARLLLTEHPGGATLDVDDPPIDATRELLVASVRLDSLIAEGSARPPTLIKIDVEGLEMAVLEGMPTILSEVRPRMIIELDSATRDGLQDKMGAVSRFLDRTGYASRVLPPSYDPDDWQVVHLLAEPL